MRHAMSTYSSKQLCCAKPGVPRGFWPRTRWLTGSGKAFWLLGKQIANSLQDIELQTLTIALSAYCLQFRSCWSLFLLSGRLERNHPPGKNVQRVKVRGFHITPLFPTFIAKRSLFLIAPVLPRKPIKHRYSDNLKILSKTPWHSVAYSLQSNYGDTKDAHIWPMAKKSSGQPRPVPYS
jgi:hypothetical protein